MLELTVRLVASLAVVVGLLLLLARVVGKRFEGRPGAAVQVLHRQSLSRSASVAVLSVGSRILVVGTTEQQVQLLTELDPEELELDLVLDPVAGRDDELVADTEILELPHLSGLPAVAAPAGPEPVRRAGSHRAERTPARSTRPAPGGLGGSVLSPETWRQALAAVTGGSTGSTSGTSHGTVRKKAS